MIKSTSIKGILASGFFLMSFGANAHQNTMSTDNVFSGTFQTVIQLNEDHSFQNLYNNKSFDSESITGTKLITLMRLSPTPEMIERSENIAKEIESGLLAEQDYTEGIVSFSESESAVDLEMNGVPVLDQGKHGTCVTFATTAALNALIAESDFIDQQCTLSHSLFLGNNYWNGARKSSEVIDPLQKYGIVEKDNCTEQYPDPDVKIKTDKYKELVDENINLDNVKYKYHGGLDLDDVRDSIDNGRRVALGFSLKANSDKISVQGFDVTVDGEKRTGGLWACKQDGSKKNYCGFAFAGHEVVIVGYDNEQKLLKIRNSWGHKVAEAGTFYMTYEFFSAMSINGTEIWAEINDSES